MPIPQWRITFDVENKMTQRPGFAQSPFGTNITQYIKSNDDEWTWQEPITGIMMLKPSTLTNVSKYAGRNFFPIETKKGRIFPALKLHITILTGA